MSLAEGTNFAEKMSFKFKNKKVELACALLPQVVTVSPGDQLFKQFNQLLTAFV